MENKKWYDTLIAAAFSGACAGAALSFFPGFSALGRGLLTSMVIGIAYFSCLATIRKMRELTTSRND